MALLADAAIRPRSRVRALHRAVVVFVLCTLSACDQLRGAPPDSTGTDSTGALAASDADGDRAPALALPVVASPARDGDLILHVTTTGQVRSDAAVRLSAEVGGAITALLVRPGARVARGEALVRLDPYPFELAVREAQAAVDEIEQRYFESYVPESLVTKVGPTPEQRKSLMNRVGLSAARIRLERAQFERARATVTSPVDGVVDAVVVAAGERVGAGQPLLTVVDTRNLRIEAQVLEHDLPLLRVGGEALVRSAGAPGRVIRGRVDALLPLVDSITRAGRAIVRVVGDGTLRPGMYADIEIESARLAGRRLVPARGVIERDGRPLVLVVKDGRAQWIYINPGRTNGVDTEVLPDSSSGLVPVEPGDEVIVDGHLTLTHDAPVRMVAPKDSGRSTPRRVGTAASRATPR